MMTACHLLSGASIMDNEAMKKTYSPQQRKRRSRKRIATKQARYRVSVVDRRSGTPFIRRGKHNRPELSYLDSHTDALDSLELDRVVRAILPQQLMRASIPISGALCSDVISISTIMLGQPGYGMKGRLLPYETALFYPGRDVEISRYPTYGDAKKAHMLITISALLFAMESGAKFPQRLADILMRSKKNKVRTRAEYARVYRLITPFLTIRLTGKKY